MAKWKKGDPSPNPSGRRKLPEDVKELRRLNHSELERYLNEFLLLTPKQLSEVKFNPESTALQLMLHSIIVNGINKGDQMRFNFILDRLLGPVKNMIQHEFKPTDAELAAIIEERLDGKKP